MTCIIPCFKAFLCLHRYLHERTMRFMSEQHKAKQPYENLGKRLKNLRSKRRETLLEVSGAVEIDSDQLSTYENGLQRPSEDILALLISYFDMKEEDADKIWELAGYGTTRSDNNSSFQSDQILNAPQLVVVPVDPRVVYTDLVHVVVNNYGVVVNFMQNAGPNNQPMAISRIGMSKEHAKSLIDVLTNTLEQHENPPPPKQLPESRNKKTQK